MHPIGAVGRTNLYNMILILLSVIVVAIVVAIAIVRHHVSFGSFTPDWIAKENIVPAQENALNNRGLAVRGSSSWSWCYRTGGLLIQE